MSQVKNLSLDTTSVFVSLEPWGDFKKEEAVLNFAGEWLGNALKFTVIADRYATSDGQITAWRAVVAHGAPTEIARKRMAEQTEARVAAWLASPDYADERRKAFIGAVKHIVADERYDVKRPKAVIEKYINEMGDKATNQLRRAVGLLEDYFAVMAEVK